MTKNPVFLTTLAGVGLAGALSACASMSGSAHPDVALWRHHPGTTLSVTMRRQIATPSRWAGGITARSVPTIDVAHRRVFVGSSDHGLYALDAIDGTTQWRFQTAGAVQSEALYRSEEDAVYFGSDDGAMYKLRAADGQLIWRFASNAEISRRPIVDGEMLYFVNANDTLVAVDKNDGKLRWFRQRTPAYGMEIAGYAGPALHGDKVYTAFSDGVVMAYRKTDGLEVWPAPVDLTARAEQTTATGQARYLDVDTTPVVASVGDQTLVFVASYEGGVFALDADSGSQEWNNDAATGVTELLWWDQPSRPVAGDQGRVPNHRLLIASSGQTGLWAFKAEDGSEQWHRDLPAGGVTRAVPWMGTLLVGTTRYGVFLFHPLDGGVIDGLHSGGAFSAAGAAYGHRAFLLSGAGTMWGLSATPPGG